MIPSVLVSENHLLMVKYSALFLISVSYLKPFSVVSFSVIALPDLAQTQSDIYRTTLSAQDQEVATALESFIEVVCHGWTFFRMRRTRTSLTGVKA